MSKSHLSNAVPYKYQPLKNQTDIRLVTIYPGQLDDPIIIGISHAPLDESEPRPPRLSLAVLQVSLPDNWRAYQLLDKRFIYWYETDQEDGYAQWEHPDPTVDLSPYEQVQADYAFSPEYEALSYTWGSPADPETAYIREDNDDDDKSPKNYSQLPIGRNLASAIRHLRDPEHKRVLWIDALCIDQSDINERDSQVGRMDSIYRLAKKVVIWLGPEANDSKHALETLEHLGRQAFLTVDGFSYASLDATEPELADPETPLPWEKKTWLAVRDLLSRPWFERLWIVQEIQLAEEAVLVCGKKQIPWPVFGYGYTTMRNNDVWPAECISRSEIRNICLLFYGNDVRSPIVERFLGMKSQLCVDPRDFIYGTLGMVTPAFKAKIEPHYGLPVERVYQDAAVAHIEHVQRLEILKLCHQVGRRVDDIPSWVPDFSAPAVVGLQPWEQFAAGYSRAWVEFSPSRPNIMKAAGVRCAVVKSATEPIPLDDPHKALQALRALEPRDLDTWAAPYPTGEPFKKAYAITLCQNSVRDRFDRNTMPYLKNWTKQDSPNALFGERAEENQDGSISLTADEAFNISLLQGRPYVVTEEGYIGFGSPGTKPGDIVCILLGSNDPIILRQQQPGESEDFTVIGDGYFYGLGDANALLGPLPPNWSMWITDDSIGSSAIRFWDAERGKLTKDDPRLGPLPDGWGVLDEISEEHYLMDRTGDDPTLFRWFRNTATGEDINSDPRMSVDALRERGVKIEMFSLA
ncbi:heterokaryon incompatibility protein-domain-containing protein [Cladorrhinum sp. PSN332]|nr:heterokaryon incompatibility protein-domain-containing protein [Cladorrhinum sp. PSN332]